MPIFENKGIELYYEDIGGGRPVVFLHGFTGSTRDWQAQIDLIKDGYRSVAMDFRGHGCSEAPPSEEAYSVYQFSDDVYALLRHLDIEGCCLVGHSMGGFTALQFALDHPDMIKGLVLVDTSSGEWDNDPDYPALRKKLDELAQTEGIEAAFEFDAENNPARIEWYRKNPAWREIAKQRALKTSVEGYVYIPRSFQKWRPVTNRLGEIKVPVLIFLGEDDRHFTRAGNILKDKIPRSQLVIVPGANHNPHQENPEFFNRHFAEFLTQPAWTDVSRAL